MQTSHTETLVVGSGLAGLTCALALAPRPVTLLTKTPLLQSGSSYLAKGGIAVALGPQDSPQLHMADTLLAAAGIGDDEAMLRLAIDGVADMQKLLADGMPFDRAADGSLLLATEAAHRYARVVHAGGDATGQVLMDALIEKVRSTPSISIMENALAYDLVLAQGKVAGLTAYHQDLGWRLWLSSASVLATGGAGMLWQHTTNPVEATADGLGMAARGAATLSDLEFVQFHPTALKARATGNLPLLTEALRGAGATLVNERGDRFMQFDHEAAELAPRDVVARSIERQYSNGHSVFLDLRPVFAKGLSQHFPRALAAGELAGFDPAREPLPVVPAAHYHMGGIKTDHNGRSSVVGLWACGEVANTGVHGANRLASNSLLEAMVYARRAASDIAQYAGDSSPGVPAISDPVVPQIDRLDDIVSELQRTMSSRVAIQRSGEGLAQAVDQLSALSRELEAPRSLAIGVEQDPTRCYAQVRDYAEARNLLLAGRLITLAALRRTESRGAHYRSDFPASSADWQRQQTITAANLAA